MATLAALLKQQGLDVRGSDQDVYPPMSDFLAAEGIPTLERLPAPSTSPRDLDLVVVGNAISRGNPELEEVLDRKIRYCSLPEAIREHFLWGARSIVIAGTHGKTTTTSLTGWLLTHGGLDPSVLVGGIARNFGDDGSSYRIGQGRDFVIEGDEYDSAFFDKTAKFLKYLPDIAVVNNVEFDHADIYADLDAVTLAFRRLVNLVPRRGLLLLGADSPVRAALKAARVSRVETFGTGDGADWQAHDLETPADARRDFSVRRDGSPFGTFEVPLLGAHNVRNALAAIAVARGGGHQRRTDRRGPAAVRRRQAAARGRRRRADGVTVYDDFAHHPTAVAETLAGLRAVESRRAHLGGVRAAIGVVVPAGLPGRLRARVRGRPTRCVIAPVFRSTLPEAERLSVPAAGSRSQRSAARRRARRPRSTTSSTRSSASSGPATSSSSCRTAGSAASIRSCCRRSRERRRLQASSRPAIPSSSSSSRAGSTRRINAQVIRLAASVRSARVLPASATWCRRIDRSPSTSIRSEPITRR